MNIKKEKQDFFALRKTIKITLLLNNLDKLFILILPRFKLKSNKKKVVIWAEEEKQLLSNTRAKKK